jgi:thioredoxin
MVKNLTKQEFISQVFDFENEKEWKFKGSKPAVIDFYANWCGPCKRMSPVLDELSKEYGEKIDIYKINTEDEYELASAFSIKSIPSLLFVPNDGQPQMNTGALPKEELIKVINSILKVN